MRALFERIVSPRRPDQLLSLQEQMDQLRDSVCSEIERIALGRSYFSSAHHPGEGSSTPLLGEGSILDYGVVNPVSFDSGSGLREYASRLERAIRDFEPRLSEPRVNALVRPKERPMVEVRGTLTLGECQSPFYMQTRCGDADDE